MTRTPLETSAHADRQAANVPSIGRLLSITGLVIEAAAVERNNAALLHDAARPGQRASSHRDPRPVRRGRRTHRRRMQRHLRGAEASMAPSEGQPHRAPARTVATDDPRLADRPGRATPARFCATTARPGDVLAAGGRMIHGRRFWYPHSLLDICRRRTNIGSSMSYDTPSTARAANNG